MKERRYRGQRIDTKEWVYGSLIWTPNAKNGFKSTIVTDDANLWWSFRTHGITPSRDLNIKGEGWFQVIPETVGEYTGLKDKNGVEIYEGDIVSVYRKERKVTELAKVYWNKKYAAFLMDAFKNWEYTSWDEVEVIGNIYENPELLEGGVLNE